MASIDIQVLRPSDDGWLDAAWALNEANVPEVGAVSRPRMAELVAMSWRSLVAVGPGGDVWGFCVVFTPDADYHSVNYRWFCDRYADFVYLDRVAVAEEARGKGVGRALYADVEQAAAGRPLFTLEVNLEPRNDASLAFHERLGFAEVGQQVTDYGFRVSMQAKALGG